jgi:hypothetical protein
MKEEAVAQRRRLAVSPAQHAALVAQRDHDPRPYVRERCAALVKIADGMSPHAVAQRGLLKARDLDTVYGWLATYEADGLAGVIARQHGGARRGCF